MIILDTNIVIAYFGGNEDVCRRLEQALDEGEVIALPTIVKMVKLPNGRRQFGGKII